MTMPQAPDGWRVLPPDPGNIRSAYYIDDPTVLFSNKHSRRDWGFDP